MSKNKSRNEPIYREEEFDANDFIETLGHDEDIGALMQDLLSASNDQAILALKLTELAVETSETKPKTTDEVFSAYKKAAEIITENRPLKALLSSICPHPEDEQEYKM